MGLPRAMYSADEHAVDLHARKLAAAMYFAGAEAVSNLLLNTPVRLSNPFELLLVHRCSSRGVYYVLKHGMHVGCAFFHNVAYIRSRETH